MGNYGACSGCGGVPVPVAYPVVFCDLFRDLELEELLTLIQSHQEFKLDQELLHLSDHQELLVEHPSVDQSEDSELQSSEDQDSVSVEMLTPSHLVTKPDPES
jgi:hypothetical protein